MVYNTRHHSVHTALVDTGATGLQIERRGGFSLHINWLAVVEFGLIRQLISRSGGGGGRGAMAVSGDPPQLINQ